jgi:hypothetical protein
MPKDGSFDDGSRDSQCQTGMRSEALTSNDKAKPDVEKCPEEVAVEQNRVPEEKTETKTKVETSSQQLPNQTIRFL